MSKTRPSFYVLDTILTVQYLAFTLAMAESACGDCCAAMALAMMLGTEVPEAKTVIEMMNESTPAYKPQRMVQK